MNPTPETSPAVAVTGLVKRFGPVTAVDGLDLRLERGSILALLGPNGAGKTTTVEICEGFQRPDAGQVRVLGLDPIADNDQLRSRIGVMLQGGGAYPGAKAAEMLRLCAAYCADPIDPEWLLQVLGLTDCAGTPYRRLSGGQQQRLALACALVGRPELVFLDEPTAGLDAHARILVWELIDRLRRDGVAVLLTTHLLDEAEALADQIVIIDHGRVVASGTAADLTGGRTQDRLRLVTAAPIDTAALAAELGTGHRCEPGVSAQSYHITGPVNPHLVAKIAAWCRDRDVLATEISVAQQSLEEVFLSLTGAGFGEPAEVGR
ncbi:putative ABC transporter ATP-binding protein [Gordonia hirsuta DSM 44140 = NBRC 16056]|uniref:Putative ABC transporter ATP-binding protein n=1 Tax=Gordonia hirsuta DSM 44140 = NBRC 16056 TaxID=1121927 RepID=L7L804_9ACTN|nr:ABC transporter ATP-binding protein [Gordonia hirsuta]GAC57285.1 putative ABC transporter ATP-binding protein [Gordonia hirsuta DSM 44140 = NBRC 16056]